jgi:Cu/Ag efflux protein CusF
MAAKRRCESPQAVRRAMLRPLLLGALLGSVFPSAATADADRPPQGQADAGAPAVPAEYTLGEIKSIDVGRGAVTIKHGPIVHLGMPDMTMRYRLDDPGSMMSLHPGDKIVFRAENRDGILVITDVAPS